MFCIFMALLGDFSHLRQYTCCNTVQPADLLKWATGEAARHAFVGSATTLAGRLKLQACSEGLAAIRAWWRPPMSATAF
jgi:hypothetical protein